MILLQNVLLKATHVLAIIDDALDHLDALKGEKFIDTDGEMFLSR